MTKTSIKQRDGETMIKVTVETAPAVIQFDDILEATEIKPDEFADAPWDNADGYEHEVIPDKTDGAAAGSFRDRSRGRRMRVVTNQFDEWGSAPRGASKQVEFEAHAAEVARTLRQIAKWHEEGWGVWGVTCDFQGYHDSCWGFYDDDADSEYMREQVREIAGNVAEQMIKDGYTIEGYAAPRRDGNAWKKTEIRKRLGLKVAV